MTATIIDPTGGARAAADPSDGAAATRVTVAGLGGLRVGLLENTKRNAAQILDAVGRELHAAHGLRELVSRTKPQFAMPLTRAQIDDLVASCDAVVVGVGDCGSCSAAAVADGIALQRAGLPVAVICTDAFAETSRAMAALQGDPGYAFLTTAHPVANLGEADIAARAGGLAADVAAALVGERAAAGIAR
jgi:hypothetical protein